MRVRCLLSNSASDRRYSAAIDGRHMEGVPSCTVPLLGKTPKGRSAAKAELRGVLQLVGPQLVDVDADVSLTDRGNFFSLEDVRVIRVIARWLSGVLGMLSRASMPAPARSTAIAANARFRPPPTAVASTQRSRILPGNSGGSSSMAPSGRVAAELPTATTSECMQSPSIARLSESHQSSLEHLLGLLGLSLPTPFVPAAGLTGRPGHWPGTNQTPLQRAATRTWGSGLISSVGAQIDPRGLLRACEALEGAWEASIWLLDTSAGQSMTARTICRAGTWRLLPDLAEQEARHGLNDKTLGAMARGERGLVDPRVHGRRIPINIIKVTSRACSTGQVSAIGPRESALHSFLRCAIFARASNSMGDGGPSGFSL